VTAAVERAVSSAGAVVRTCDGSSDAGGPEGKMMRGIVDVFSSYERDLIKARTKAALATKKAKGERVGQIPYGFDLDADGVALVPNAAEQEVMALVVDLASRGKSQRAIAAHLTERGIRNRAGGEWAQTSIARMLNSAKKVA
jgi:DNA invertase Pin-like site-specific DNA recombinase